MSADPMSLADEVGRQIPPLWPLSASVAVNPFLGQADQTLAFTHAQLRRVGGVDAIAPRAFRCRQVDSGTITRADLAAALMASPHADRPANCEQLMAAARAPRPAADPAPTLAELAKSISGTDWPEIVEERFGHWAAGYFDQGQALWAAPRRGDTWTAFRSHAVHDLTPEILGLKGFARFVADAPDRPGTYLQRAIDRLGLSPEMLPAYWHTLLLTLGGWAQYARYQQWQAELEGGTDSTLVELLAIRLLWDEALFTHYGDALGPAWAEAKARYAQPVTVTPDDVVDEILQEAAERAGQRQLAAVVGTAGHETESAMAQSAERPALQAAFCIDVRSEVFRRALEKVAPSTQTFGFAGFFGLPVSHQGFASDVQESRLPALLAPGLHSRAGGGDQDPADAAKRHTARAKRAWGRFKLAAVSSFAFVEAMGPVYITRLIRESLGLAEKTLPGEPTPHFTPVPDADERVDTAETILRAMSLTEGFAPLVLLMAHHASVTNNPHGSALQCGACGGYAGDVNARLLASLLNDSTVRAGLTNRGIDIPDDTCFMAGLHDTTRDRVRLYDQDVDRPVDGNRLKRVQTWMAGAGELARTERGRSLPRADSTRAIERRARDWSEVRPEWGLAGCQILIAAPRTATRGVDLGGRAFLHDYDWRPDAGQDYPVLELILTAPVIVASWISLQYYGSAVAPELFGAGNKLIHNIVGGIGVLEGNGGMLRTGLPWQSVHDGERQRHDPLRLTVAIQAPKEAISDTLARHPSVQSLFDNRWLHLLAMDNHGRLAWRYTIDGQWSALTHHPEADTASTSTSA
ncbi:YbcC family protein [Spiribacter vilamensis]|uniref:Probable inorganic carbon transporter subunit DabA n=1 Tax=Spiribacter vilamensis TaxID=531306 RepID=A0A4Q8D257_9GAMM|nr:DUF2309 domain-containing protein [Spiribacter vilamensis]RZU99380.1 hypothetical protein EV698_1668 [Spiribacter vilamensis]TVO61641.1 DUF2309 domain-containing protein [Spiribacter vilamensis]